MVPVIPASRPVTMSVLERWPINTASMATTGIAARFSISGQCAYQWMMRLTDYGYFIRTKQPRGGTPVCVWTITNKGRDAAAELQRIKA